jgi:GntR family transcriptional regulator
MIMSGDLAPGEQLPPVLQLVKDYHVANTTVQRALLQLKTEGFLESQRGRGVYVRDKQPFVVRVAAYTAPTAGAFSFKLLTINETSPVPADVAAGLMIAKDDTAVLRYRLNLYDGDPVALSWSYYPTRIAAGSALAGRAKIRGGAPRALTDLGYPQRRFIDRVSARPPTTEELLNLQLPAGMPVLRRLRVVYSDNDMPVEVSVLVNGAHLYELEYHEIILEPSDS